MNQTQPQDTKQRIIEAAGPVFAERGFYKATIREICRKADVNIALVKYHFGEKFGLYKAVLSFSFEETARAFPQGFGPESGKPAAERLHDFIYFQLLRTKSSGRPAWHERLIFREMVEPTNALQIFLRQHVLPINAQLMDIVREVTGRTGRDMTVLLCCLSIVGQCLHHQVASKAIPVIYPEISYGPNELRRLADHITRFSLAGMRAMAAGSNGDADDDARADAP